MKQNDCDDFPNVIMILIDKFDKEEKYRQIKTKCFCVCLYLRLLLPIHKILMAMRGMVKIIL